MQHEVTCISGTMVECNVTWPQIRIIWVDSLALWRTVFIALVDVGDLPQLWVHFPVTPQRRMWRKKHYLAFCWFGLPSRAGSICPAAAAAPTVAAIVAAPAISLLRAGAVFPSSHHQLGTRDSSNLPASLCQTGTAEAPGLLEWVTTDTVVELLQLLRLYPQGQWPQGSQSLRWDSVVVTILKLA